MITFALVLIGLALVTLGSWAGALWRTDPPTGSRPWFYLRRVLGLALATGGIGFAVSAPGVDLGSGEASSPSWEHELEPALARAKTEKRPVIVDAWASWCKSCKKLAQETFADPRVSAALDRFVRVKLNMDLEENEPYWERFDMKGLPWVGFFTPEGELNAGLTLTDFEAPDDFVVRIEKVDELVPEENIVASWVREKGLLSALVLVFFFGIAASFTPCVYPLIPVVLGVIGTRVVDQRDGKRSRAFLLSLAFTSTLVVTYAAIGAAVAASNSAIGRGTMQNPWVVGTVVGVFFLMALSLLGLFSFQLPAGLQQRLQKRQINMADARDAGRSKGYGLAAFSGVVAALVAAPCVGPVLVGILAYASQLGDPLAAFGLMLVFGCGFGLLFLVLGTFSGLLSKIPKSGPWMERVKVGFALAFAFVALTTLAGVLPALGEIPEQVARLLAG